MNSSQKYKNHVEKRKAFAKLAAVMERKRLSFNSDAEILRNQFLHLEPLRQEVVSAAHLLLETDMQIVDAQLKADEIGAAGDLFGQLKAQGSASAAESWTRMSLGWKIFLYSVRCFQDCIYKAILQAQLQPAGPGSSMSSCISGNAWRVGSSVAKLINEKLPAYPDWFIRTRELRNALKSGLSVESVWRGREPEHCIVLCEQRWNGHMIENSKEYCLNFEFASESLEMCLAVIDLIPVAFDEMVERKQARCRRVQEMQGDLPDGKAR